MIRIAIAEDHQALIDGIKSFFTGSKEIELVGTANNGEELLNMLKRKRTLIPQVVITDIRMPIMDGIVATKHIKKEFPDINILAFTMFDSPETINKMLKAGAHGYILKNSGLKIMIEAIQSVAKGKKYFDPNVLLKLEEDKEKKKDVIQHKGVLSKREKEILQLISERKTSAEIADILNIAENTVNTHRRNMYRKLNLKNRTDLFLYAAENKFEFKT